MNETKEKHFMRLALVEAIKGKGLTNLSPIVGSLLVENSDIVAKGHYEYDGGAHAEVNCLNSLRRKSFDGAELYVTLEPCSTKGRTGACTDVIIESGIKKVIVGAIDPNPDHKGNGLEILKQAGIEVISGVLEKECNELNDSFNQRMKALNHAG